MSKLRNFGAGPAKLPEGVYDVLKEEMTNFENTGLSLMETSHRSSTYEKFNAEVQDVVRKLLEVPVNYKILLLQGGGQGQFAGVPLNLISRTGIADYVVTGTWSSIAAKEAAKYGKVNLVLPDRQHYNDIPDPSTWKLDPKASYVHICDNDTIHGIEFKFIPETNGIPLVADMSSNIMTKKFDVSKFGVIYACAQKNMGTAGVTLVIVREDLLGAAHPMCPSVFDWTLTAEYDSILNTPPVYAIEVMGRVLQLYFKNGGVEAAERQMEEKSRMVYEAIDRSGGFYLSTVASKDRSRVNVPFRVGGEDTEAKFLSGAEERGMVQLHGHKLVGGIRVSLYNSVTLEDVEALVSYMNLFHQQHTE